MRASVRRNESSGSVDESEFSEGRRASQATQSVLDVLVQGGRDKGRNAYRRMARLSLIYPVLEKMYWWNLIER